MRKRETGKAKGNGSTSPTKRSKGKGKESAKEAKEQVIKLDKDGNPVGSWFPFSSGELTFHAMILLFLFGMGWHFTHDGGLNSLFQKPFQAPNTLLGAFATRLMDWENSTTPAPISVASTLAKAALRGENEAVKPVAGSVPMAPFRKQVMDGVYEAIRTACLPPTGAVNTKKCDLELEADSDYGMTPLHYAHFYGDTRTVDLLTELGSPTEIFDRAGRKPANLSYTNFVKNSRNFAAKAGNPCEIPEVIFEPEKGGVEAMARVLKESARLVFEGEPVIIRNVTAWLRAAFPSFLPDFPDGEKFVEIFGNRNVTVGGVPYANKFNLETQEVTLRHYRDAIMRPHEGKNAAPGSKAAAALPDPPYVFQQDGEACKEGYYMMDAFAAFGLPTAGSAQKKALICPASSNGLRLAAMHYYLGSARSGAPMHVHSDAANFLVKGRKRWWIVPPNQATFSTKHIHRWMIEDLPKIPKERRPLECEQRPGDFVYVPFDWGHGAINLEDGTFGYTMELVNRRDTLMSVVGRQC